MKSHFYIPPHQSLPLHVRFSTKHFLSHFWSNFPNLSVILWVLWCICQQIFLCYEDVTNVTILHVNQLNCIHMFDTWYMKQCRSNKRLVIYITFRHHENHVIKGTNQESKNHLPAFLYYYVQMNTNKTGTEKMCSLQKQLPCLKNLLFLDLHQFCILLFFQTWTEEAFISWNTICTWCKLGDIQVRSPKKSHIILQNASYI